MTGTEIYYIITHNTQNREKIPTWIKQETQDSIIDRRMQEDKARSRYLIHLGLADTKRTFDNGKRKNYKQHTTYQTLAMARFHTLPTIKKLHDYKPKEWTNPYRQYMKEMYPDQFCHFCKKKGIETVEDTEHLLQCENRETRNETAKTTWEEIYKEIGKKQGKSKKNPNPKQLKPFALRTKEVLDAHLASMPGGGPKKGSALKEVNDFPDVAALYGLIPSSLTGALVELKEMRNHVDGLANYIAKKIQNAIASEYLQRCRTIAEERDAKEEEGREEGRTSSIG